MNEPILTYAQRVQHATDARVPMHRHANWELVYYLHGRGETEIGGKIYSFTPHSFALIAPGIPHNEHHFSESKILCLNFDSGEFSFLPVFAEDSNDSILTITRCILSESRTQKTGYREMLTIKLRELFIELSRKQNLLPHPRKTLDYAIHYLEENYCRKIRLQDLAAEYGYGYDYFHHRFRTVTGKSPQQYLLHVRLQAAQALLRDTEDSCTEIALQCGFYSSAQFSASFRGAFGYTPTAWRKKIRSNGK